MPLTTIKSNAVENCNDKVFHVSLNAGSEIETGEYQACFQRIEGPIDGEHGPYYRFVFEGDGVQYIGFVDVPKRPTAQNRLGRFLMGLAGKPLEEAAEIRPSEYVGQRYLLSYGPNKNGKVSLQGLTPLN